MAREMTPQERAAAIVDKVKSALTPIWLGGRQRMLLEQEIAEALTATRRAALLDARQAISKLFDQQASELPDYYAALLDAGNAIDRLAQEG